MRQPMRSKRYTRRTVRPRLWFFLGLFLASTTLLVLMLTGTIRFGGQGGAQAAGSAPAQTGGSTAASGEATAAAGSTDTSAASGSSDGTASGDTGTEVTSVAVGETAAASSDVTATTVAATPSPSVERTPGHENMPAFSSVAPIGNVDALKKKVQDMVATFPGKYGVTFVNLATGERFGVNDTDEYIAASTSKFPMNILLWKKIAAGEIDPESMLTYTEPDLETGTGIIQNEPYGTQHTVRETSKLSIEYSDNCGINMIIRLLDIEKIRQYIRDEGGVVEYGKRHRSCPSDMANCAVDLYEFYYENPAVAGELIDFLENTKWNERINGSLPKEVKVAHKIGNQTRTANDVGIVFASQPFVLSVMTDGVDFDPACRNIAMLSKMIYEEVEAAAAK